MRKGDLVRLNANVCFTKTQGGELQFPLSNYAHDEAGTVDATRLATKTDISAWHDSDASRGLDCGGESKLPPTAYSVSLKREKMYTLLRARCAPIWSYRRNPGHACVLDLETGFEVYVNRKFLEVVS